MIDSVTKGVRSGAAAVLLVLAPFSAAEAVTETVQPCEDMKAGWSGALRQIDPSRPELVFGRVGAGGASEEERASNLPDADARLTCLEGIVSRLEVRQVGGDGQDTLRPFLLVATALLAAFDLTPVQAAETLSTMRAEAESRGSAASSWGAYEMTYAKTGAAGGAELVIGRSEN